MPEYQPVPRLPKNASEARLRRTAGAFKSPGGGTSGKTVVVDQADYTVAPPAERIFVTTGSVQRTVTLPSVETSLYKDIPIYIQKVDDTEFSVRIEPIAGEYINISGQVTFDLVGQGDGTSLISDGSLWHSLSERRLPLTFTSLTAGTNTFSRPVQFVLISAASGNATVTLPGPVIYTGLPVYLKRIDSTANTVTIDSGSDLIDGVATKTLTTQYEVLAIMGRDTGTWYALFQDTP
jgi:hypothetical protein